MNLLLSLLKVDLIFIVFYVVLLWDYEIFISYGKYNYHIEYKGLVWVFLDYYTIIKYKSLDVPMKWLSISKTIN